MVMDSFYVNACPLGLVKGSLFMSAGMLLQPFSSVDEIELRGRGREWPWMGIVFAIAGLGLSGNGRNPLRRRYGLGPALKEWAIDFNSRDAERASRRVGVSA